MHTAMIADELLKVRFKSIPGRMQEVKVIPVFGSDNNVGRKILLDGAHNQDAAVALKDYVDKIERRSFLKDIPKRRNGWPVTWVLAMTDGKDAKSYLETILRDGDNVITTAFGPVDGMPWVKPMDPTALLSIAQSVRNNITGLAMPKPGTLRALCAAKYLTEPQLPIVMAGSLYLAGDFHREMQGKTRKEFWTRFMYEDERKIMREIHNEERQRIQRLVRGQAVERAGERNAPDPETAQQKQRRLAREIEALDMQIQFLDIEQEQVGGQGLVSDAESSSTTDAASAGPWSLLGRRETPYPRTNRAFPGKFKELRVRSGRLGSDVDEGASRNVNEVSAAQQQDESASVGPEEETKGPRIRMHWSDTKGDDRRLFSRPDFIKEKKWGA
jgi:hypothetical protein